MYKSTSKEKKIKLNLGNILIEHNFISLRYTLKSTPKMAQLNTSFNIETILKTLKY